jgi:hypothetical protein
MSPLPPIETRALQVAKKCKIFRNGDKHYSGKNITLDNRKIRTFDAFLTGLTNDLKLRNGAVRKLVTPHTCNLLILCARYKMYVCNFGENTPYYLNDSKKGRSFN